MQTDKRFFKPLLTASALVFAVAACQQQDAAAPQESPAAQTDRAQEVPELEIEVALSGSPDPVLQPPEPERPPLDLSIPQDILNESADTGFALNEKPERLPNLFNRENSSRSRVSGKFLFEDEQRASLGEVNGAQINVEVPLK